jgi:hypothetical protein
MSDYNETNVRELKLFAENDGELYRRYIGPFQKTLLARVKNGTYDHEKSKILWKRFADIAAKAYLKEFGTEGDSISGTFSLADRREFAKQFADEFRQRVQSKETGFGGMNPSEVDDAIDFAVQVSHAFDAGNYAAAYESQDMEEAWEKHDSKIPAKFKPAFIMGFYSSYELDEMEDPDEYFQAEHSKVGQAVLEAGYTEAREEPIVPDDEDLVTENHKTVYSAGKLVLTTTPEHFIRDVNRWMEKNGFYPNVWFISDHGNAHLIDVTEED